MLVIRLLALLLLLALLAPVDAASAARATTPRLTAITCVPTNASGCARGVRVRIGRQVQLRGRGLKAGMRVTFRWPKGALATKLQRRRVGWVVRVPAGTRLGQVGVYVRRTKTSRRSNMLKIRVVAPPRPAGPTAPGTLPAAFRGNGMWIWQLSRSEGGNVDAIAARAKQAGIETVFVKAADAGNRWPQWSRALVQALHDRGLRACAWQFVYGENPDREAAAAIDAVHQGADCFVIDAESHYQGRYAAAQEYLRQLRMAVGPDYPVGLTSFPYVDLHPRVPYSVFLGPNGAQANLPQVYWKDIGDSVDAASAKTAAQNRIYERPLSPIGQSYASPSAEDMTRFRAVWAGYGAGGLSWWSWQATDATGWSALSRPAPAAAATPDPGWPALGNGARGDQVAWMQQHLAAADPSVTVTGTFDATTDRALRSFQAQRGLRVSGTTDAATWAALLELTPVTVDWGGRPAPLARAAARPRDAVVDHTGR